MDGATRSGRLSPLPGEGLLLVWTGLALALGNPKTMLFYLALLPGFVPLGGQSTVELLSLGFVVMVVYTIVLASYAFAANRVRTVLQAPHCRRAVQRAGGAMMAGAATAIALR